MRSRWSDEQSTAMKLDPIIRFHNMVGSASRAAGSYELKALEHPAVTAFGATTIIVFILLAPLVSPLHHELYHFYGPPSALILPVLFNFAEVWILLALLLAGGFRFRRLNVGLWGILGVFLPLMLMQDCFSLARGTMSRPANAVFLALLFVAAALLLAMRSRAVPLLYQGKRFATVMLGFAALNGALILAQILWSGWQSRRLDSPRPLRLRPKRASTR